MPHGIMVHYTLNTGHLRVSPRSEVADAAVRHLQSLTRPGAHVLPWELADNSVVVPHTADGLMFTVYRGNEPLVTCGVADCMEAEDEVWATLERLHLTLTDKPPLTDWAKPEKPRALPWLAVVILGPLEEIAAMEWLVDIECCLAWAWLESQ